MSDNKLFSTLVENTLTEFKAFGTYVDNHINDPRSIGAAVAQKIAADSNVKPEDVKEDLINMQVSFAEVEMVRGNIQMLASKLATLAEIATMLSLPLNVDAEDEMLINDLKTNFKPFFTIKNEELVPVDSEMWESVMKTLKDRAEQPQTMSENFNAIKNNIQKA